MYVEWFLGFTSGASHHTCNLPSVSWVIYAPMQPLVSSGGTFLGSSINNVAKYSALIELLRNDIAHGITCIEVRLDS